MGQKGTSVDIVGVSATFITLTKLIGQIDTNCGIIQATKMHMNQEIADGNVDAETKGMVETILDEITGTMNVVQEQSAAIKKQVDKLLAVANEIQSRSRSAGSAVNDRASGVKKNLSKR